MNNIYYNELYYDKNNKKPISSIITAKELKELLKEVPDDYVIMSLGICADTYNSDKEIKIIPLPIRQVIEQSVDMNIEFIKSLFGQNDDIINSKKGALYLNFMPINKKYAEQVQEAFFVTNTEEKVLYTADDIDPDFDSVEEVKEIYRRKE